MDKNKKKQKSKLVRFSVCMPDSVEKLLLDMCEQENRKKSPMIVELIRSRSNTSKK